MRAPNRHEPALVARAKICLATFVLGLLPAISHAQNVPDVRVEQGDYVLFLPEPMQATLRSYNPEFQPYRHTDYLPTIQKSYTFSSRRTLFSVIRDFNGDGILDVALEGHSSAKDLLLVILSEGKAFRVVEIRQSPYLNPRKDWYGMGQDKSGRDIVETGRWNYLERKAPGKIKGITSKSLVLKNVAFEEVAFEKASILYYYDHGQFRSFATSD